MGSAGQRRTRIVVGFLAIVATVVVLVVWLAGISRNGRREIVTWSKPSAPQANHASGPVTSFPASDAGRESVSPQTPTTSPALPNPEGTSPDNLIIPVAGVRPDQLRDTFSE